jgi:energy-coupling factor transporter ATP-binding protein EcfA2
MNDSNIYIKGTPIDKVSIDGFSLSVLQEVDKGVKDLRETTMEFLDKNIEKSSGMADFVAAIRTTIRTKRIVLELNDYHCSYEGGIDEEKAAAMSEYLTSVCGLKLVASSEYFHCYTLNFSYQKPTLSLVLNFEEYETLAVANGDKKACDEILKVVKYFLPLEKSRVRSYYFDGDIVTSDVKMFDVKKSTKADDVFYPWLKKYKLTLDEFVTKYLESKESILCFLGAPGTGKTTLMRYIASKLINTKANIGYTDDSQLLIKGGKGLMRVIERDEIKLMLIDDADVFLNSQRVHGNNSMSAILNTADGFFTNPYDNVKFVFSSNLTKQSDIESALLRSGRCFGVIKFEEYSPEYAQEIADRLGLNFTLVDGKESYSLADVVNSENIVYKQELDD